MSNLFNTLLTSNTLNFLVVAAIIVFLCVKLKLTDKTDELKNEITEFVKAAENEKEKADNALSRAENSILKLPKLTDGIKEDTEKSIKGLEEKYAEEAESAKSVLTGNSERQFKLEVRDFKQRLTKLLTVKSVELAEDNAKKMLKDNTELHRKYIDEAISEINGLNL